MTNLGPLQGALASLTTEVKTAHVAVALRLHPFLSRSGTSLTLAGNPHRLVGLNVYTALWGSRYQWSTNLTTAIPIYAAAGVNTVRVWGVQASAITAGARDWTDWDAALALFAANGIKVIVVLTDQWTSMPIRDSDIQRNIDWFATGYRTTVEGVSTYRNWVAEAVTRYRNNPTIGMWQLINEGFARNADDSCTTAAAKAALRVFADDMAGLVKGIDPNHLVSAGFGIGNCGTNEADWAYVNAGANLDVMDRHDYGLNNDGQPGDPLGNDDASNGFTVSRDRAVANDKVFIIGEAGIHWLAAFQPITRAQRASLFDAKLSAQFAAGSQGELLWAWHDAPVSADPARDWDVTSDDPALSLFVKM